MPRPAAVAAVLTAALIAASCGGSDDDNSQAQEQTTTTASSTTPSTDKPAPNKPRPKPKPKPDPGLTYNPLTGMGKPPNGPVVAVKIDDTQAAYPQVGINQARITYIEQVEGGLTRLVAVYAGDYPDQVAPVRSVRASDTELLGQYGPIAVAFSGAAAGPLQTLHDSPLVDVSADARATDYVRLPDRAMPYDLAVGLSGLADSVPSAGGVKDIGLTWDAKSPTGGAAASTVEAAVGSTPVGFRWDAGLGIWVRTNGGTDMSDASGAPVGKPNVIVQYCEVSTDYADVDVAGNPSAATKTVGSGKAELYRDGKRYDVTWKRPNAKAPTRFVDGNGKDVPLRPGGAWVVLAAK